MTEERRASCTSTMRVSVTKAGKAAPVVIPVKAVPTP